MDNSTHDEVAAGQDAGSTRHAILRQMIIREFLLEPQLYLEAGLDTLPEALAKELKTKPALAIDELLERTELDRVPLAVLERLVAIRDMDLISRTAATVATDLSQSTVTYDRAIRVALCYAVADMQAHTFAALRAAAAKHDDWARHHLIYGLVHGLHENDDRARWELELALQREPYEDGRARIYRAIGLFRQ